MNQFTEAEIRDILHKYDRLEEQATAIATTCAYMEGRQLQYSFPVFDLNEGVVTFTWEAYSVGYTIGTEEYTIPIEYLWDPGFESKMQQRIEDQKETQRLQKEREKREAEQRQQEKERREYERLKEKFEGK
jgi:hypothetical protein